MISKFEIEKALGKDEQLNALFSGLTGGLETLEVPEERCQGIDSQERRVRAFRIARLGRLVRGVFSRAVLKGSLALKRTGMSWLF